MIPIRLPRGRRAAASSEWIIIAFLMIAVGVALVTAFGRNLSRRFAGSTQALDNGTPIAKSAPVAPLNSDFIGGPGAAPNVPGTLPTVSAPAPGAATTNPGGGFAARTPDDTEVTPGLTLAHPNAWNPQAILAGMTQIDQNPQTNWDNVRCALASALASRVMAGPEAVDRLLADLMLRANNGTVPNYSAGPPPMVGAIPLDQYIQTLGDLRDRLAGQTLDHRDLGTIMELMYEGYSLTSGGAGTYFYTAGGPQNYQAVMELGQGVDPGGNRIGAPGSANNQATTMTPAQLATSVNNLRPGESITLGVDEFGPSGPDGSPDHFIVVGRDANGRPYLYDPWPHTAPPGSPVPPQLVYYENNQAVYDYYLQNTQPTGGFIVYSPVRH